MRKPTIGIFKLTSCDGCQLSVLDLGEELLKLLDFFEIRYFREAADLPPAKQYDVGIVEGSISASWQREEIIEIRERSRFLMTIGACATAGGLQGLRNWANLSDYKKYVYPSPAIIDSLAMSTPVSDHVYVDYELWGCPINGEAFSEALTSLLLGKKPGIPTYALCMDCKMKGIPCVLVAAGEPCLGPVTRAGCGVLCPSLNRPCYGCFGPKEEGNLESLVRRFHEMGLDKNEISLLLDKMNTYAYRRARFEEAH